MRVTTLGMLRFPTEKHAARRHAFPDRGVVLVTGPNGSGKSSMVEAIAWTCWGKTLRDRRPEDKPLVTVGLAAPDWVERDGDKLRFSGDGGDAPTRTKALEALSVRVGTWDEWRRTHVFSSSDSSAFAGATDAERKRLVEGILGLGKFDEALDRCRGDLQAARSRESACRGLLGGLEAKVEAASARMKDATSAREALPKVQDEVLLRAEVAHHAEAMNDLAAEVLRTETLCRDHLLAARTCRTKAEVLATRVDMALRGECPHCGAPWRKETGMNDQVALDEELSAEKIHGDAARHWMGEANRLKKDQASHRQQHADAVAALRIAGDMSAVLLAHKAAEADALHAVEELTRLVALDRAELRKAEDEVAILVACEQVLGLKGARALVLERALAGIGEAADAWLRRLSGGALGVRLELSDGNALALRVEGAGGGDYAGCSGGQRRRIDVALLLALAEVSAAAIGREPGTLWLDEVFDALDEEGTAAAAECVRALAEQRCCVVITHNQALADALRPDVHVRMEGEK